MDSMRSLNTSLPGTSPPKSQAPDPPEQLLQSFKDAALAVTKLYKTSIQDQSRLRSEGYQDALDDLLAFLDKEDIGLNDGEGWRIRRWATERLDGKDQVSQAVESDDEVDKSERDASPVLQRTQSASQLSTRGASPVRTESAPPTLPLPIAEHPQTMLPPSGQFTFRSSHAYPQDTEMASSDQEYPENTHAEGDRSSPPIEVTTRHPPAAPITVTRPARSTSRHNNQSNRHGSRTSSVLNRLAGQKRKLPNLGDFFDLGNLGHGKDSSGGGGKRGRFA